jgi:hypothetical protein
MTFDEFFALYCVPVGNNGSNQQVVDLMRGLFEDSPKARDYLISGGAARLQAGKPGVRLLAGASDQNEGSYDANFLAIDLNSFSSGTVGFISYDSKFVPGILLRIAAHEAMHAFFEGQMTASSLGRFGDVSAFASGGWHKHSFTLRSRGDSELCLLPTSCPPLARGGEAFGTVKSYGGKAVRKIRDAQMSRYWGM